MENSQDHTNTQHSPGGGKSHVCTKCGWNYPNPHPSAKNRRAHKKICGTIKGFEILDSQKSNLNLDLQTEHCLVDEQKTPSPRVVEKTDERIGEMSEEDVFADAVCEFSSGLVSDSVKEKEETGTNGMAKSATNPGETQQCNKSSEVVQENFEVSPVEVPENSSSTESASRNQQAGEGFTKGNSMASESLIETSQEAQVIDRLETEGKENIPDESESKLASALGKRVDTSASSWNDEVIYSDLEGPHGFAFEEMSMPGEADSTMSENVLVDTSYVKPNEAQVISTSPSVADGPVAENADVSLHGTKGLEEFNSNPSVNYCSSETSKGEECETGALIQAENLGCHPEGLSVVTGVPSSDKLPLEDKTEPQGQTSLVGVKEDTVMSKIDSEDIKMKAEEGESSFGASKKPVESETVRTSLPTVDPIVADLNADVSHSDLTGTESELTQANVVAEENNTVSELSSESSCYVSPVSVVLEGDDGNCQNTKRSAETFKDSIDQIGAEAWASTDFAPRRENSKVEESSFISETNTKDDPISHLASTGTAPNDSAKTVDQKLLESGKIGFNRVVGGLGVIQANEIDGNDKAHDIYAEVPVTIESNDHRDFGRLQNLSEAHIRSLVSSPLVSRDNTSNASESNLRLTTGLSDGVNKPENESQTSSLSVALSKNQEITMEKTTSWSTAKEQHVPLKNLLNEARSPRLVAAEAKKIPRVSSILDQETSPEEEGGWPERREVSEEWNSPAKYPVERKVKGRPFWVPFVCCSSAK